jgi:cobalamin biosynthesis protein CobD/CbiB
MVGLFVKVLFLCCIVIAGAVGIFIKEVQNNVLVALALIVVFVFLGITLSPNLFSNQLEDVAGKDKVQ